MKTEKYLFIKTAKIIRLVIILISESGKIVHQTFGQERDDRWKLVMVHHVLERVVS